MSNWQKWIIAALLLVLLASTVFAAGFGIGRYVSPLYQPSSSGAPDALRQQFAMFWDVWQIIEQQFYREKPLDYHEMVYGAIRGMVDSLGDPHTAFLTPSQRVMFSEDLEGEFGGIGVTVHMTDEGKLMALRILPASPALQADLQVGDLILEVDGTSLQDKNVSEAIGLIRGPSGTQVRLLIQRGAAAPFEIVLTRAVVSIPTVESRMLEGEIAYLALTEFNAKATAGVRAALDELLKQNPRGLILDLRGNPGGYLHVADEVASEFLAEGVTLTERGRDGEEIVHKPRPGGRATSIPLAVLVDAGSASASEIVAGAIQDQGRGVLVGEKTYGKGSVQITQSLSDGSGLQVTVRRWYTPAGHQIDGVGLTPDIPVAVSEADLEALRDPALQSAVAYLLGQTPQ